MIRLVVVEDQVMVLEAFCALLQLEEDFDVVAKFSSGKTALDYLRENEIDVLITDIEMPNYSGLDLVRDIQLSKMNTKPILLTTFAKSGYANRALATGVRAYLLKDSPIEALCKTIRQVNDGETVFAPELLDKAFNSTSPLTERETDILQLVLTGASSKEIGEKLFISNGTVRNYTHAAVQKLGTKNRVEAAQIAKKRGWI